MTLGSLYIKAQGYVPVLLENECCVLVWNLVLGWGLVSVHMWRLLDELLLINVPWSQEFSGVLKF